MCGRVGEPWLSDVVIVRPWYRQFYLRRGDAEWLSDRISDEGYAAGLEVVDGFGYVGTTMYGSPTEVVLRVYHSPPDIDPAADKYAEALLDGPGDVSIHNWDPGETTVATIAVPSGLCRVRASWYGTTAAEAHPDNEIGGTALSPERIHLEFWPATQLRQRDRHLGQCGAGGAINPP